MACFGPHTSHLGRTTLRFRPQGLSANGFMLG